MRSFGSPPQFNPENQPEKIERPLPPKEKIFAYLKYRGLKIREYLGQLNQEDFDQLLALDFQEQLRDIAPIAGVFSPEDELAKIKGLPREQKRKALITFKENLASQREALASCRVFIERNIEFNHDVPREKLLGLVEQFSAQYGFDDKQKQITEQLIDWYYANRQRVLEIRKNYPNNAALVMELSGVNLDNTAKLDISTGPMSIDITTDSFNAGRIFKKSNVVAKFSYSGFASRSSHEQPILYIVINKGRLRSSTLTHEYEHQKNKLFRKIFDKQVSSQGEGMLLSQYEAEQDTEIKRELLETYFRLKRQEAFQDAKDEVIAMKKDEDSYSYNFFFKKDNSPYDYLADVRNWKPKKGDTLWEETAERVLVDDYKTIFKAAVSAFDQLEKKGKYTRGEIIAMFADKALPEWPKTARRLLEQKEKG